MRLFFEENINQTFNKLSSETNRHVTQVLRMKTGEQFLLTNGKGIKAIVEIERITKRDCSVKVLQLEQIENQNPDIHLAISFTKNNTRMEWLLEKVTEIGVRSIYPIITKRSERKEIKTERFNKKLMAAMLQSQQYHIPILHEPISLDDLLNLRKTPDDKKFDIKFIAHCESGIERTALSSSELKTQQSKLIGIGPEGDFTIDEIENALQQNFKSVSLGKNRLRTETAGLVAVTLLHHNAG
jgi:16S rRNA (uracil1498-N3)-methyltransferase